MMQTNKMKIHLCIRENMFVGEINKNYIMSSVKNMFITLFFHYEYHTQKTTFLLWLDFGTKIKIQESNSIFPH